MKLANRFDMSYNKKKTKHHKQKGQKAASAADADARGADDALKDIDQHPLDCGHSIVVLYRDASERLAKVRVLLPVVFLYLFPVLDHRAELQQIYRPVAVLHTLL